MVTGQAELSHVAAAAFTRYDLLPVPVTTVRALLVVVRYCVVRVAPPVLYCSCLGDLSEAPFQLSKRESLQRCGL